MKLANYIIEKHLSWGVVAPEGIIDIPALWPEAPPSLQEALHDFPAVLDEIERRTARGADPVSVASVKLLPPVPRPGKLIGIAVNYLAHHDELERDRSLPDDPARTTTPRPFLMPPTAVIGPGEEIPWPVYSREIDYEVELAVVIGRRAADICPADAREVIGGYTIANDISARSCTHAAGRSDRGPKDGFFDWLHGKWADGFCPMGPCLVTPGDGIDPTNLTLSLEVDGRRRQEANTRQMIFDVYELVSFCSRLMTLEPGDVIATGTPSGVGAATGDFLEPGQTITCTVECIGTLTNVLGPRPAAFYEPCATQSPAKE